MTTNKQIQKKRSNKHADRKTLPSVLDVAGYILAQTGENSMLSLECLLYVAQCRRLFRDDRPLFIGDFRLDHMLPSNREVRKADSWEYSVTVMESANPICANDQALVQGVLVDYGHYNSLDFRHLLEYEMTRMGDDSNTVILHLAMAQGYAMREYLTFHDNDEPECTCLGYIQ